MIPKNNYDTQSEEAHCSTIKAHIALTDVSYKLYMTIQGRKIDNHIIDNNEHIETQAGFTKGSQIEDNLFILQYCIEKTYKRRKPLIVTCIDYTKAYDSIKRESILETLATIEFIQKSSIQQQLYMKMTTQRSYHYLLYLMHSFSVFLLLRLWKTKQNY